ncbi:MAG: ABC-2 transporter permease [bacterium]|nr:ABC-2 transporter permease [bacterium]
MSDARMILNIIRKDLQVGRYVLLMVSGWWLFMLYITHARGGTSIMVSGILLFQAIVMDDHYRTGKYFVSLPLKRSAIVLARYAFALLVMAVMPVISYVMNVILHGLAPSYFERVYPFEGFVWAEMVVVLFVCLAYPVHFRYGSELDKGMKAMAVIFVATILLLFTGALLIIYFNIHLKMGDGFLAFIIGLALVGLGVSMWVSLKVFAKREF